MEKKEVDVFFTPYPDFIYINVVKYKVGAKILDGKRVSLTSWVKPLVINKDNQKKAKLFNNKLARIKKLEDEILEIYKSMEGFDPEKHLPVKEEQK